MDFAVCPACGQSVLDDDVENCPFCGSSMKAKPGVKPPVKATATVASAAAKPAAKAAAKPAADDLPFDAETNLPQTAVPVSPTPSKSKSLKVVCPMCDTVGYVPPTAAGKNVKCANAKCHMPVFTAPAPQVEAPPAPLPKKKGNPLVLGAITAVVVCAVGGVVWWFASKPTNSAQDVKPLTPEDVAAMKKNAPKTPSTTQTSAPSTESGATTATTDANTKTPTPAAGPSSADLIKQTLRMMLEVSLGSTQNRSKPYCRRLASEASVLGGDMAAARDHLDQLFKVGAEVPFYRIPADVELFWQEQAKHNTGAANEALNRAVADAAKLPKIGRDQLDLATRLAAALVVAGRAAEARTLIKAHQSSGLEGETSAYLQAIVADPAIVDARRIALRPVLPRQAPQAAATTALLVIRNQPDAARDWAKGWDELHIKGECLTALVEAAVLERNVELPAAEIAALPAEHQLLLWARAARRQAARDQLDAAKDSLAKAVAQFDAITTPTDFVVPEIKTLIKWKPSPTEHQLTLAAGAGELALVQHQVAKDAAAAQKALDLAMQACRNIGPAHNAAQRLQSEAENLGPNGLRQKLKVELERRTDDLAKQDVGVYRTVVANLVNAAQERFETQTTILSRAAQAGLEDAVWTIVSSRTADADPSRHEPYFSTEVAGWLVERFRGRGSNDLVQAVTAAAGDAQITTIKRPATAEFDDHLNAGKFREAVSVLQRNDIKHDVRESLALAAAVRLAGQDPLDKTWQFIGLMPDIVLREQAYDLTALISTRRKQAPAIVKQIGVVNSATEKISLGHGMVAGLTQDPGAQ